MVTVWPGHRDVYRRLLPSVRMLITVVGIMNGCAVSVLFVFPSWWQTFLFIVAAAVAGDAGFTLACCEAFKLGQRLHDDRW